MLLINIGLASLIKHFANQKSKPVIYNGLLGRVHAKPLLAKLIPYLNLHPL